MSRYPAPCGEPWQGITADTQSGAGAAGNGIKICSFYPQMKAESQCFRDDNIANTIVNGTNPRFHNGVVIPIAFRICSYASNCMKSDNPNSGIYETDKSRTLDLNGGNPACNQGGIMVCVPIMLESHPNDSRIKIDESGQRLTLTGRMGTGGGNVPLVMSPICTLDCRNIKANKDVSGTLQAKENGGYSLNYHNPVCVPIYAIDRAAFNQGANAKFDISIKDDGIMQTIVSKGPNAVAVPIITINERQYALTVGKDIANTLTATDYKGVQCVGIPIAAFQGQASSSAEISYSEEVSPTIQCTKQADILTLTLAELAYIVRRLTPSECAKLQGFPSDWHEGIINEKGKPIPDTAAYKGYGNAVATVCAEYPIASIIEILKGE